MDIKVLERARATVIEMLEDRGYVVPLEQKNITRENLIIMQDHMNVNIYVSREGAAVIAGVEVDDGATDYETDGEPAETQEGEEIEEPVEAEVIEDVEDDEDEDEEGDLDEVVVGGAGEEEEDDETPAVPEAEPDDDAIIKAVNLARDPSLRGGAHSKEVYVYFHIKQDKFNKKKLESVVTQFKDFYKTNDINIIIVVDEITAPVFREAERESYYNVEIFYFKDFQVNRSRNILQPKFELLSTEEIAKVAAQYGLTPEQMFKASPRLFTSDPMARYHGFRDGDMCRVTRRSEVNGMSIAYRAVVYSKDI